MFSSADSKIDAISSLARLYDTSPEEICRVIGSNHFGAIDWQDRTHHPIKVWQMGQQLGCQQYVQEVKAATYYHRTRYNGTAEWFEDGLVSPVAGAVKVVEAMHPHLSKENYKSVLLAAKRIIEIRESSANEKGPCAFDVFDYALRATGYLVPEFVTDLCLCNVVGSYELKAAITEVLDPVIVKFRATPVDTDDYVAGLWCYLYRLGQSDDLLQSPHICTQPRRLVQFGDILELKPA